MMHLSSWEESSSPTLCMWSQVGQWLVTSFPWAGVNYIQLMLCRIFSINHPIYEGVQGLHSFHHFPSHFSMRHELLLSEEDCSGDLRTGDDFQAKWHFTLQYFSWLCWTFLSHLQVYLEMFRCRKHAEQHLVISKLAFCHFLIFFQQTPCITGLLLCSSWNGKKIMAIRGISHNPKRNYCSNQTYPNHSSSICFYSTLPGHWSGNYALLFPKS